MKPYYVMIHSAGPYVTGFIVPQAKDEKHAIKQLRVLLWAKRKNLLASGIEISHGDGSHPDKLQDFIRSLRRPWRFAGVYRKYGEKKSPGLMFGRYNPMVRVVELQLPCMSGYWLEDILRGTLCNIHDKDEMSFATKSQTV